MNYLTLENVTRRYGEKLLFEDISLHIDRGQKIGLIAKNGSGKTTLLKVIAGLEGSEGENARILLHKSIRVGSLEQEPHFSPELDVLGAVLDDSDNPMVAAVRDYELALSKPNDEAALQAAMLKMDDLKAWTFESKVKEMLSRFNLNDFSQKIPTLSGGQQKRLALVRLLLQEPDFLILDEPTNHLDVEMIEWLEDYLQQPSITLFMVTHDRYFLENICDSIIELDGGVLHRYSGSYSDYLEKKALREESEATTFERQKKLLKTELEWVRKSPAARTSKSKARVDSYYNRVDANEQLKSRDESLQLAIKENRMGSKIVELHNVQKAFGEKKILNGFSYKFRKKERVGIVGQNGTGKSTFLDLLTKTQEPDMGKVIVGDTITFGHYRQDGIQLSSDKRVIDAVRDIADVIPLEKGRELTAAQLLERFLFSRPQQQVYVSQLSGGEKRRLYLLMILMANPNFLILDEPTNDLDVMTLQVLEDFLTDFPGVLLVVTHDRYFMDRLVEHLFVFEGEGEVRDFNGTYIEYRMKQAHELEEKRKALAEKNTQSETQSKGAAQYGLSKSEKNELRGLERDMEKIEKRKKEIMSALNDSSIDVEKITALSKELGVLQDTLDEKEMRWLELDEKQG